MATDVSGQAARTCTMNTEDVSQTAILIARIDERTALLLKDIEEIRQRLDKNYVSQDEFKPVKALVYGLVTTVLLTMTGAVLTIVIRK